MLEGLHNASARMASLFLMHWSFVLDDHKSTHQSEQLTRNSAPPWRSVSKFPWTSYAMLSIQQGPKNLEIRGIWE